MVMTANAIESQTQQRFGNDLHGRLLRGVYLFLLCDRLIVCPIGCAPYRIPWQLACQRCSDPFRRHRAGHHLVARQLLTNKLVIRHVVIESSNYPVAIPPKPWMDEIADQQTGLGPARDIKPMSSPSFTIVRRSEQPTDHFFPGPRRAIGHEFVNLIPSRESRACATTRASWQLLS